MGSEEEKIPLISPPLPESGMEKDGFDMNLSVSY
jgi:hypothetical protein